MSSKEEMIAFQKAALYDLRLAVDDDEKETYTKEELLKLIDRFVKIKDQTP